MSSRACPASGVFSPSLLRSGGSSASSVPPGVGGVLRGTSPSGCSWRPGCPGRRPMQRLSTLRSRRVPRLGDELVDVAFLAADGHARVSVRVVHVEQPRHPAALGHDVLAVPEITPPLLDLDAQPGAHDQLALSAPAGPVRRLQSGVAQFAPDRRGRCSGAATPGAGVRPTALGQAMPRRLPVARRTGRRGGSRLTASRAVCG